MTQYHWGVSRFSFLSMVGDMQQPTKGTPDGSFAVRRKEWVKGVWNSAATSYQLILTTSIALVVMGLIMVLSSSAVDSLQIGQSPYAVFSRQATFAFGGLVLMIIASRVPLEWYKKFSPVLLLFGFGLQMLIFTPMAKSVLGNTNWIKIPGTSVQIQPSEFLKIALCVFLGTVIARRLKSATRWIDVLVPAILASGVSIILVMAGDDLGTAMIFFFILAGAVIVAGVPMKLFAVGLGFAGVAVGALALLKGSGGMGGVGLGAGREKWSYLPEAHNDFIFAVLGEELGFMGTISILVLFILLGAGIIRIIRRHQDPMAQITTAAIGAWIIGQAALNIGVVTRVFPVIGVPLPLVSAGGSALIATMLAIGVLLAFARSEPDAREAFSARSSVVRRTFAIVSGSRRAGKPVGASAKE